MDLEFVRVALVVLTIVALVFVGATAAYFERAKQQVIGAYVDRLKADLAVRDERIKALEFQIDTLHSRGILTDEPPPAPEGSELLTLPPEVEELIDGFEDEEAQAEASELARLYSHNHPDAQPEDIARHVVE